MDKEIELKILMLQWFKDNRTDSSEIDNILGIPQTFSYDEKIRCFSQLRDANYLGYQNCGNSAIYTTTLPGDEFLESLKKQKISKTFLGKVKENFTVILAILIALASLIVAIIALSK